MFLAGAHEVVDGMNCEEVTCPVLMINRGLAPKALNSFPTSSSEISSEIFCDVIDFIIGCIFCRLRTCCSVENIYALGNKGSMKTLRSSQEEEPLDTYSSGESQDSEHLEWCLSRRSWNWLASECLLCLSYRANYCE